MNPPSAPPRKGRPYQRYRVCPAVRAPSFNSCRRYANPTPAILGILSEARQGAQPATCRRDESHFRVTLTQGLGDRANYREALLEIFCCVFARQHSEQT
jgi:hypothetical protein